MHNVIDYLLNCDEPAVVVRTKRDILDTLPTETEISAMKHSKNVKRIYTTMHPDGYWLYRGVGDKIDYSNTASTHYILSFLAELGMDRTDDWVDKAVNRYLNLTEPGKYHKTGQDHKTGQSCLYAYNLRTFIRMGYRDDERIQERIDTLHNGVRFDNGYLCVRNSYKTKTKSCIRGSMKALMAYAELPEYWNHPSCQRIIDYFLSRNIYFKKPNITEKIRDGMTNRFPFDYGCSLTEPLIALSKMGYGNHTALNDAWESLEKSKDSMGRYRLHWTPPTPFKVGGKGEANPWVTYYALLAQKYRDTLSGNG